MTKISTVRTYEYDFCAAFDLIVSITGNDQLGDPKVDVSGLFGLIDWNFRDELKDALKNEWHEGINVNDWIVATIKHLGY